MPETVPPTPPRPSSSPTHPAGEVPAGSGAGLFSPPPREPKSFPTAAVGVAAALVLLAVAVLAVVGRRHQAETGLGQGLRPVASYAPHLKLSDLQMSQSTSLSGGKETYIDGHIANNGPATVTAVTAQVFFVPEAGGAPQIETVPVNLIRMRQPYIDTEPMNAAPLAPGAGADFRLIFDDVNDAWNQQQPEIHVIQVTTK